MEFLRMCPARLLSEHGMYLTSLDGLLPIYDTNQNYYRSWLKLGTKDLGSTIENDKGDFKITLDVQHFRPNEVSVRVNEREIIVEGQHEERADAHGFISRQFKRRYALPDRCLPESVTSTLSSDGVLSIIAEKQALMTNEIIVPIKICGALKGEVEKSTQEKDVSNNKQIISMEEHSRLFKPDLFKAIAELSSDNRINTEPLSESKSSEKPDASFLGATSKALEESFQKYNLEMSALMADMAKTPKATTPPIKSESVTKKSSSNKPSTSMTGNMTSKTSSDISSEAISAELREAAESTQ